MKVHASNLSPRLATSQNQTTEMKLAFDWALKMMNLLQKLHDVLRPTVEAWRAFDSEDGDVGYVFDGLNENATTEMIEAHTARHRSIRNIKRIFCELDGYQNNIDGLREKCSDYKRAVSYPNTPPQIANVKNFC